MKRGGPWPRKHIRSCVFYWCSDSPILISTQCLKMLIGSILGTRAQYGMTTESRLRSLETSQSAFPAGLAALNSQDWKPRKESGPPESFTAPSKGGKHPMPFRVFPPFRAPRFVLLSVGGRDA